MSIQAMAWAIEQQLVTDAPTRHVLLCLANYADKVGMGAFPSAATLAKETGLSERTVRQRLEKLQAAGIIKRGNQAIAAAYIKREDRRPVVYDLCITGVQLVHPVSAGCISGANGVQLTTGRGARPAPKPFSNPKADPARAGARAGDKSPGKSEEPNGRQPPAAEVIAASRPRKPADPVHVREQLDAITRSLRHA